jgi:hypothetical protein
MSVLELTTMILDNNTSGWHFSYESKRSSQKCKPVLSNLSIPLPFNKVQVKDHHNKRTNSKTFINTSTNKQFKMSRWEGQWESFRKGGPMHPEMAARWSQGRLGSWRMPGSAQLGGSSLQPPFLQGRLNDGRGQYYGAIRRPTNAGGLWPPRGFR